MESNFFSGNLTNFIRGPLGIIALFIVLVYGFASMVVGSSDNLEYFVPLIYFMVLFPVIVFCGFLWLVSCHHTKLYGPSDFKHEENYIKTQNLTIASLVAASAKIQLDDNTEKEINKIIQVVSNVSKTSRQEKIKKRILWVDDNPENNSYERKAFEAQGVEFSLALSTAQALTLIKYENYDAIISDMGRNEGREEGYLLLSELKKLNIHIPFMIYSSSNSQEHKALALERGAIGSTNMVDELFSIIMGILN